MANKLLLQARSLSKHYGEKIIFDDANVSINERMKVGVIGRNGAGKSTFFKILMGLEDADSGEIAHMPDLRLGYIPQIDPFTPDETVRGFLMRYTGRQDWECDKTAGQFGLKGDMLAGPIGDLSGGYQMRVKLTATLLFEPNLLLLDEPTNYLDLSTLILLENFLKTFKGGFLCITHDREFLKKTCTSTMEVEHGKIILHHEPLEEYLAYKEEQQKLAISINTNIDLKQKQLKTFISRFGAKASMAKSAQSKAKQIERLERERVPISDQLSTVKMNIPSSPARSGVGLTLDNITIGYPEKTIARNIKLDVNKGQKVAILGDNGQGKSTLLKTLAGTLDCLEGSVNWSSELSIAYYAQHVHLALDPEESVHDYLKRMAAPGVEDAMIYMMMGNFLFRNEDQHKQVKVMSGGEKARLCLAGMFLSKSDVLLLDEPTNHLDYQTVEAMGEALKEFNGTVFVVSHDRTFVQLLASEIWEVQNGNVQRIIGDYSTYIYKKQVEAEQLMNLSPAQTALDTTSKSTKTLSKAQKVALYKLQKKLRNASGKLTKLEDTGTQEQIDTQALVVLELEEQIAAMQ